MMVYCSLLLSVLTCVAGAPAPLTHQDALAAHAAAEAAVRSQQMKLPAITQQQTSNRRPQQQTSIRKPQPSQPSRPQGFPFGGFGGSPFGGFSSFGSPFGGLSGGNLATLLDPFGGTGSSSRNCINDRCNQNNFG